MLFGTFSAAYMDIWKSASYWTIMKTRDRFTLLKNIGWNICLFLFLHRTEGCLIADTL